MSSPYFRNKSRASLSPKPPNLLKVAVLIILACGVVLNCRTPHHLETAAGDASGEPPLGLPWLRAAGWHGSLPKLVGTWHLSWGLGSLAAATVALAAWYCTAQASPARRPWSAAEVAAALASAGGTALRLWCFHELGRMFTYEVGIRQGHTLVQTGPYALLLHPSYLGTMLMGQGFLWFAAGPRGTLRLRRALAVQLAFGLACLATRVAYEERMLEEHFGEAWRQHRATRWRFIPLVI